MKEDCKTAYADFKPRQGRLHTLIVPLLGLLILILPAWVAADSDPGEVGQFGFDQTVPAEVKQAALDGLEPFLHSARAQDPAILGFHPDNGFDDITIGEPYRIMTVDPQTLLSFNGRDDLRSILRATDRWVFPVMQRGEPRSILTVGILRGEWKAVSIGSPQIAGELIGKERMWSDEKGYSRALVRVYQATTDMLLIMKDDQVDLSPFGVAHECLKLSELNKGATDLYTIEEITDRLIPAVRLNLEESME